MTLVDRRSWLDERRAATRAEHAWTVDAGLMIDQEAYVHARDAWGHRHFLVRAPSA